MEATEDEVDKTWSHPEVGDGKIGPTFLPSVLPWVHETVEAEAGVEAVVVREVDVEATAVAMSLWPPKPNSFGFASPSQ